MNAALLGPARISGDLSQRVFDTLLRTIAEPGTVRRLPDELDPGVSPSVWLPLALADVGVEVHADNADVLDLIVAATGATPRDLERALLVVLHDNPESGIARLATGTALAPEEGARVALSADRLISGDADGGAPNCTLRGPGIAGTRRVTIEGVPAPVLTRLGRASGPAPTGIDAWLFAPDGDVMAIPRTTTVEVHATSTEPTQD